MQMQWTKRRYDLVPTWHSLCISSVRSSRDSPGPPLHHFHRNCRSESWCLNNCVCSGATSPLPCFKLNSLKGIQKAASSGRCISRVTRFSVHIFSLSSLHATYLPGFFRPSVCLISISAPLPFAVFRWLCWLSERTDGRGISCYVLKVAYCVYSTDTWYHRISFLAVASCVVFAVDASVK
jgi:hypothetical protein